MCEENTIVPWVTRARLEPRLMATLSANPPSRILFVVGLELVREGKPVRQRSCITW